MNETSVQFRRFSAALVAVLAGVLLTPSLAACAGTEDRRAPPKPSEVLAGLRSFLKKTARPDGSFRPGADAHYPGISDSGYSDLAPTTYAVVLHTTFGWKLPHEAKTVAWFHDRQQEHGAFINVAGTADPKSAQARLYNTTQGIVALRALGRRPRRDPLPVLAETLKGDYKTFPLYTTSFYPLAYQGAGQPLPKHADRELRALMIPAEDGYLEDHIAATFHMVHYYRLMNEPTPNAEAILKRALCDQKPDGSWLLNPPSRDRHATFDAVFVLRQLGHERSDCRRAIAKAAKWALSCQNSDGGFGHFPGSTSDLDACYFQVGTLVMAGFLKPADSLPPDPHLLAWGHLFPVPKR
ncbi:MAG TPA: prenyltransferase/squalene oxidase repeat-containing protein [Gemmataceae bacterium]|nr:prenyltransferase/squalene oxidase repeat-containing protein [Gemmataceae bacterium]